MTNKELPIKIQTECNVKTERNDKSNLLLDFIVTLFFGYLGIHKFMKHDNLMGFIYLFTGGILGIGWLYDTIKSFIKLIFGK